jgi:hypothetical protein
MNAKRREGFAPKQEKNEPIKGWMPTERNAEPLNQRNQQSD